MGKHNVSEMNTMAPSAVLTVAVFFIDVRLKAFAQDTAIQACPSGSILTSDSGTITSANYPNDYDDNLNCRWTILASNNTEIQVSFLDFDIEGDVSCRYDSMTVFIGGEKVGTRKYCGTRPPRNFTAPANRNVTVVFVSDHSIHSKGFSLTWNKKSACSDVQFTCWNDACISLSLHCDGVKDCTDNSDEIECARKPEAYRECGKSTVAPEFPWDYRVIGGSQAKIGSYPWQAMIVRREGATESFHCGGSIIDARWILTAAHCISKTVSVSQTMVYVGKHRLTSADLSQVRLSVVDIIVHPRYSSSTFANDIALILVNQTIVFTDMIRPICLQTLSSGSVEVASGTTCIITGWGRLYSEASILAEELQQVRVAIVKQSSCTSSYGAIPSNTICAGDFSLGGVDSCSGDSGGPLVCLINETAMFQVGITSFGRGCAEPGFPGVYTKVNAYSSWINQIVKTYTPLLSLEYANTTSSPPSSTHIITNDETSIPSTTTITGFSTQDITTATSQESSYTSIVQETSQTMRTEANIKTLTPSTIDVLPTTQPIAATAAFETNTPTINTQYASTTSSPLPKTLITTTEETSFPATATNTEVTTRTISNDSTTNGTAVTRSLEINQTARNNTNTETIPEYTTDAASTIQPAGSTVELRYSTFGSLPQMSN